MNHTDEIRLTRRWHISKKIILIILICLAVIAWIFVIYEIRTHALGQSLRHHRPVRELLMKKPAQISDINSIQSWMTFDYINTIFYLPPTFLQQNLSITDSHYPHLSLQHAASEKHESVSDFTTRVKNSIKAYMTSATSTSPSSL